MIEFQDMSFSYPDSTDGGLKHIDLTISDGQCVLLCGRSGCGKTTLTRLINGLIPQFFTGEFSGKVLLDGKNLADFPMYRIAERVGSVFHSLSTAQSHKATFAVLGNIRKQGLAKLARMPLGDVQAKGSGELKNIFPWDLSRPLSAA